MASRAARHLGRLAGTWLGRVPAESWLFTGWIERHSQPEAVERDLARLPDLRQPNAVESRVGFPVAEAIELIELQSAVASVLRLLPQTLCHHDAVGANVFPRGRDGIVETVLIDWEMVGPGPVGADLASLLFASARRGDVPVSIVHDSIAPGVAAYAEGMRDAGRPSDPETIAHGFHAAVALRWSLARDVILAVDAGTPVFRGSAMSEPPEVALDELISLTRVLRDSAANARAAAQDPPRPLTSNDRTAESPPNSR